MKCKEVFPVYHDSLHEVNPLEKESFLMQWQGARSSHLHVGLGLTNSCSSCYRAALFIRSNLPIYYQAMGETS